jgi:pyruvate kinase
MPPLNARTKIVCTLGPSTGTVDVLVSLIDAGMDVARLNFSHGTMESHQRMFQNVREAARRTHKEVTVLQDLQGPKIRIGAFSTPSVELQKGGTFTITTSPVLGDYSRVSTTYAGLARDVHPTDWILLDDGKLRLRVLEVKDTEVICQVIVGGTLSAHKGINLPNVPVNIHSPTAKDLKDLEFSIQHDLDYLALSFVRTAEDIRQLRVEISKRVEKGRILPIIAKVEKPQAIANIDEIIREADAIMVARGDLGIELPPEDVPVLQKMIVRKCNLAGKPVIIATQMLESMIGNPSPTRAETSDVANAVIDGADAVMLSGETSIGKYPLETVEMMDRIIRKVESGYRVPGRSTERGHGDVESRLDALSRAACELADQMRAAAIIAVTRSGATATSISRYRPHPPIVTVTDRPAVLRRLNVFWGINGIVIEDLSENSDAALEQIQGRLVEDGLVKRGDNVIVLASQPFFARGSTNFIKVERIP